MATGPLTGIRILDMTSVLMGPFATQILGDYGADIIKIESEEGDLIRLAGALRHPKMGSLFLQTNRNKRSVLLDAKSAAGRTALLTMLDACDVFVSNIRPAALARLGLSYEDLRARKPDIIYVALVGYGQDGPYRNRPAYDDLIQGISGIPALSGQAQRGAPQYAPITLADKVAGLNAAHAILAALLHKERHGGGQHVEVPMFEVMTQLVLSDHMGGHSFDPGHGPSGYNRLVSPDRRPYQTADGFIAVLVYTDTHWKKFFDIIGRPDEYARNPLYHDHATRTRNYDEVYRFLAEVVKTRTSADWQRELEAQDIPWAPVHNIEDLIHDEHIEAVGLIQSMDHPSEGKVRLVRPPIKFSKTPLSIYRHVPTLGEHTREVLSEFGIDLAANDAAPPGGAA